MISFKHICKLGLIAIAATCVAWTAFAASAEEAEETPDVAAGEEEAAESSRKVSPVEEMIVTTRKREEKLQEIPLSVTAFSAIDLAELNVDDASGVSDFTPNLVISRTASGSSAYVTCMRGLCRTDTVITDDPYVGIYLNGVYTGKAIGSVFEVADIERVEVNRGPQGTLFGKNTIGGAVNIVTAKPSGEAGVKGYFLGGSYATTNFKAVVELPAFAGISTKLAYLTKHHDSYTTNVSTNFNTGRPSRDLQDQHQNALLFDALWEPTESFSAEATIDWMRTREAPWANLSTTHSGALGDPGTQTYSSRTDQISIWEEGEGAKNDAQAQGYGLILTWEAGDLGVVSDAVLKSITSHRRYENDYNVNNSGFTSFRNLWTEDRFKTWNTGQELQFTGTAWDERIDILAGFFYLQEKGDYRNKQGNMAAAANGTFQDSITNTSIEYNSYALFTEETLHITDELALSAGVRFTREDREGEHDYASINSDGFFPGGGTGLNTATAWSTRNGVDYQGKPTDTTFRSSTWSPRAILSWQALDELMLFGGWSRGFKSGGFNARSTTAPHWNPYGDQKVDSYELGLKSAFWDSRATVNATGFYQDVTDAQVQFNRLNFVDGTWEVLLANAGDARIYGAEVESSVTPCEGLELRVGFGITENEYTKLINPFTGADETGSRHMEFSPKYNWSAMARYEFQLLELGVASVRLDYAGSSDVGFNTNERDDYVVGQEPYGLLHARVALDEIALGGNSPGAIGVAFVGKNLTGESYRVGGYGVNLGFGSWYTNVYGPPRFVGGEITYRWGTQR